jgi:DnaJ-class molecular chaperone
MSMNGDVQKMPIEMAQIQKRLEELQEMQRNELAKRNKVCPQCGGTGTMVIVTRSILFPTKIKIVICDRCKGWRMIE